MEMYREARARPGDPVAARAETTGGAGKRGPRGRPDRLDRNGHARPRGLFPERKAEGPR